MKSMWIELLWWFILWRYIETYFSTNQLNKFESMVRDMLVLIIASTTNIEFMDKRETKDNELVH